MLNKKSKILIGCETSGAIRKKAREKGLDIWSCDLLPSDDGEKKYHIVSDIRDAIKNIKWDVIIMHPPCTYLTVSGNAWYAKGKLGYSKRLESIEWTMELFELAKNSSKFVCMENPVNVLPIKASQYIQPWQFGHGETKKTGLWLHNLPDLQPTNIVDGRLQRVHYLPPSKDRAKIRSTTFSGIADAIVQQWLVPIDKGSLK